MYFVCTHMYICYPPGRDHPCHCPDLQVVVVYLAPACLHHAAFLEILQVHTTDILSMYSVQTEYVLSTYWYVLSMYSVWTQYRAMPAVQ